MIPIFLLKIPYHVMIKVKIYEEKEKEYYLKFNKISMFFLIDNVELEFKI